MADSASAFAHTQMATNAATYLATLTFYVALFTDTANPLLSGTEFAMPGYSRQSITLTATGTVVDNGADITFGNLGSSPWGGYALFDASTGGNNWFSQDFFPRLAISSSVQAKILASALTIDLG